MDKFRFSEYNVPDESYKYGTIYDTLTELDSNMGVSKIHPNSQIFSGLFRTIPELDRFYASKIGYSRASEEYNLYAIHYKTYPLVFRHLVELYGNEGLIPAELIWRQRLTAFPSNTAIIFDPDATYMTKPIFLYENLTAKEREPDVRLAFQYPRFVDENVSTALALMLVQQDVYKPGTNERVKNPWDLKAFEEIYPGLKVDFDEMHLGLHRLIGRVAMATLNNLGAVQRVDHEIFYTRVAAWQLLSAIYLTRNSKSESLIYPYIKDKTIVDVEDYPVPGYLPYAFVALYHYIDALPDYLTEGKAYDLPYIVNSTKKLYDFAHSVLKYNVSTDKLTKSEANDTWQELLDFEENFKSLFREYIQHPELLNKQRPKRSPSGLTANNIRAEILHAGAKSNKKSFIHKFRNRARRGDI